MPTTSFCARSRARSHTRRLTPTRPHRTGRRRGAGLGEILQERRHRPGDRVVLVWRGRVVLAVPAPGGEARGTRGRPVGGRVAVCPVGQGTSETCRPSGDGAVERKGAHATEHDVLRSSVVVFELVLRQRQVSSWPDHRETVGDSQWIRWSSTTTRVVRDVDDERRRHLVAAEEGWPAVQSTVDEPFFTRYGRHEQLHALLDRELLGSLIRGSQGRPVWPAISRIRRTVKGDDGVYIPVGDKQGFERDVLVGFAGASTRVM